MPQGVIIMEPGSALTLPGGRPKMNPLTRADSITESTRTRFMDRFNRAIRSGDCLLWPGARSSRGYGRFSQRHTDLPAHRASYLIFKGDIGSGMCVCHSCDTPACVNPDHLWMGTFLDNNRDRKQKGRGVRGEQSLNAKLTEGEVSEIRRLHSEGQCTGRELAARFGISTTIVSDLCRGKIWTHVPGPIVPSSRSRAPNLTPERALRVLALCAAGQYTQTAIARMFGVSLSCVNKIVRGKRPVHSATETPLSTIYDPNHDPN